MPIDLLSLSQLSQILEKHGAWTFEKLNSHNFGVRSWKAEKNECTRLFQAANGMNSKEGGPWPGRPIIRPIGGANQSLPPVCRAQKAALYGVADGRSEEGHWKEGGEGAGALIQGEAIRGQLRDGAEQARVRMVVDGIGRAGGVETIAVGGAGEAQHPRARSASLTRPKNAPALTPSTSFTPRASIEAGPRADRKATGAE